ncbi:unnamed protein product [Linum trigynum]|uniref:DCD domain-containing protein n=1 Tax=Linum trigynum TaxID=586398 RepID=A0AAV2ETC3_9ROSI
MVMERAQDSARIAWDASHLNVNGKIEMPHGNNLAVHTPNSHLHGFTTTQKEENIHNQESLAGFIFLCNRQTKPQCYQYRVFGVPIPKLHVVQKIKPGMKLFLFDFDAKLLYGVYVATSCGVLNLEPAAFGGNFPAQVSFRIDRDCLPVHDSTLKHIIHKNYQKGRFTQELSYVQVQGLLSAFRPFGMRSLESVPPIMAHESMPVALSGTAGVDQSQPLNSYDTTMHQSHDQAESGSQYATQTNVQPQHGYYGATKDGVPDHLSTNLNDRPAFQPSYCTNSHDSRLQLQHTPAVSAAKYDAIPIDRGHQYGHYRNIEIQGTTHLPAGQQAQLAPPTLSYSSHPYEANTVQHGYVLPAAVSGTLEHGGQQRPLEHSLQPHIHPSSVATYDYKQGQQGYSHVNPPSYAVPALVQQAEPLMDPYHRDRGVVETHPNYQYYNWNNHENYRLQQSQVNHEAYLQQGSSYQQYSPTTVSYTQPHHQ